MIVDKAFLLKFLKFATVGTISFAADFGVTYMCKEKFKLNKFIANTMGFTTGLLINFVLNRFWTFNSNQLDIVEQFVKFLGIACFALVLNTLIIYILNVKIRMNFYVSKIVAVAIVMFYNFTMNYLITFANT